MFKRILCPTDLGERSFAEFANENNIDLIVNSTEGRDNLRDFVTGTITEHVINQAKCPTLVIAFLR